MLDAAADRRAGFDAEPLGRRRRAAGGRRRDLGRLTRRLAEAAKLLISPLVGEMSGRTEGGAVEQKTSAKALRLKRLQR